MRFEVVRPGVPEGPPASGERAEDYARRMARDKASAVSSRLGRGVVLGADTVVVLDGAILGKPGSAGHAVEMLRRLRGRGHCVITGLAAIDAGTGRVEAAAVTSTVYVRRYGDDEIVDYVASGEPFDKAGAYGVQDTQFSPAERVEGCYLNVVGLPLCRAAELMARMGVSCLQGQARDSDGLCTDCGPTAMQGEEAE